jgi:hypothetical protein
MSAGKRAAFAKFTNQPENFQNIVSLFMKSGS